MKKRKAQDKLMTKVKAYKGKLTEQEVWERLIYRYLYYGEKVENKTGFTGLSQYIKK